MYTQYFIQVNIKDPTRTSVAEGWEQEEKKKEEKKTEC